MVAAPVEQREVASRQAFTATVMPVRRSVVGSATDGRVVEFLVNDGDRVEKGQSLAQLRTGTLEIEIAGAKAELELRRQELLELKNGARPEEVDQAKARAAAAEALAEYATARFKRTQRLFESGQAITQEEYEQVRSAYLAAEQSSIEAQKGMELVVKGPRAEQIAQAAAQELAQQEVVRLLEDRLDKHTIRAPFDGFVVAEHTEEGAWVRQGEPVAEVVQIDPVEIEVAVPEAFIRYVRAGQDCGVTLDSMPDESFTGEVARVVPQANLRSRTFPVKVQVPNEAVDGDHPIKAGMLARVALTTGRRQLALLVPKDALVLGGTSPVVFAVVPGKSKSEPSTVRLVPVRIGFPEGSMMTVEGELQPGELVVVAGNERLRPNMPVSVTRVAPSTTAGASSVAR